MKLGHKTWCFPDGDLPPRKPYDLALSNPETHGHESLVILNPGEKDAQPILHVFFPDDSPWEITLPTIPAQRVRCFRTDEPLGERNLQIPFGQYALILKSDQPVIAQLGRMDVRQANLAYYTVLGHPSD